jgi:uncharacterized membrane protein
MSIRQCPIVSSGKCRTSPDKRLMVRRADSANTSNVHYTEHSMLPNPLHPAIVHFPVVLAFLLPIAAIGAVLAIRRGARPRLAWAIPTGVAIALAASTWLAVETGEQQGERVERVVSHQALDSHQEMAELLLAASAGLAVVAVAGLAGGLAGRAARIVTAAGSVLLIVAAARTGHSGGQLVYKYGAASAYTDSQTATVANRAHGGDDER